MKLDIVKINFYTTNYKKYFPMEDIPFWDCIGRKFIELLSNSQIELETELFTENFINQILNHNQNSILAKELLIYKEPVRYIQYVIALYTLMSMKTILNHSDKIK